MENLIKIIKSLKKIRTEERLKINDEILFDCAIRIFNSRKINPSNKENNTEKATQKQLDLLFKLDTDFDSEKITKQEAKILIQKEINRKRNDKRKVM